MSTKPLLFGRLDRKRQWVLLVLLILVCAGAFEWLGFAVAFQTVRLFVVSLAGPLPARVAAKRFAPPRL